MRPDKTQRPVSGQNEPRATDEPLLTVAEIAQSCQVCERTVRRWIADGDLPVVRFGRLVRIRPRDHLALIRRCLS
ncbi:MAG: helix-turn-helix domain-containing protein [Woeseiaceae bacterium]|nr:helix-turn-helix domain-containing protein [Woeseiaceae bacterium]